MLKSNRRGFFATIGAALFASKVTPKVGRSFRYVKWDDTISSGIMGKAAAKRVDTIMTNYLSESHRHWLKNHTYDLT